MRSLAYFFIYLQFLTLASPKAVLVYERAVCRAENYEFIKSVSCNLTATKPPRYNLNFITLVDVDDLKVDMKLWASFFSGSKREKQLLNITKNVCSLLRKSTKGVLWEAFIKETWRHGNLPRQCPLKKNVEYSVKDFVFDVSLMPGFMENTAITSWMRFYKASHPKSGVVLLLNGKIFSDSKY